MRISDWSSDVCSSDLRLSRQAARRSGDDRDAEDDAAGEGIADREPRGRDRAVRREIRRCLGACAATRKGTRADLRPPLRPSEYRGGAGDGGARDERGCDRTRPADRGDARRKSEEDTSELELPMRKFVAVFY